MAAIGPLCPCRRRGGPRGVGLGAQLADARYTGVKTRTDTLSPAQTPVIAGSACSTLGGAQPQTRPPAQAPAEKAQEEDCNRERQRGQRDVSDVPSEGPERPIGRSPAAI